MRMRTTALLTLVALAGCGRLQSPTAPGLDEIDPSATFTRVQTEVFTPSCAFVACHASIGAQQGLVLAPGAAYASIVGRPSSQMPSLLRVAPGDPASSYLYRKITGSGIAGDRMPQGMPALDAARLALVRDWIRRGAPND